MSWQSSTRDVQNACYRPHTAVLELGICGFFGVWSLVFGAFIHSPVLESPQVMVASHHNDVIDNGWGGVTILPQLIHRQNVPVTTGLEHRELARFVDEVELPVGCHWRGEEVSLDPGDPDLAQDFAALRINRGQESSVFDQVEQPPI